MRKVLAALVSSAALIAIPITANAATDLAVSYDGSVVGLNGIFPFAGSLTLTGHTTLEDALDGSFAFSSFTGLFNNTNSYTLSNVTASFNGLNQLELFTNGTRFTSFQFVDLPNFVANGTNFPVVLLPGQPFTVSPNVGPVQYLTGVGSVSGRTATAPVPEPATWALMLLGFGFIGAALRRRRQQASSKPSFLGG